MDINAYLLLVPSENSNKEKFMKLLESILQPVAEEGVAVESMGDAFDLDNAAGDQLDVIGELVGVSRLLPYAPSAPLVVDNENVYTREMTDEEYKLAIRLKIARNEWDGINESARKIYDTLFSGDTKVTFTDNQDSTITVNIMGDFTVRQAEILNATGFLLIPAGVGKTVNVIGGSVQMEEFFDMSVTGVEWIDSVVCT